MLIFTYIEFANPLHFVFILFLFPPSGEGALALAIVVKQGRSILKGTGGTFQNLGMVCPLIFGVWKFVKS